MPPPSRQIRDPGWYADRVTPGDLIGGRFYLEEEIGAGGMGVVYRATDLDLQASVAVKILSADPDDRPRATREIAALAGLHHPAIVRHVANGTVEDGRPFLVMEWIDGVTANAQIQIAGFTLAESVQLLDALASALGAAHALGIVHRDIKPSNVLLEDGDPARVKLIDFGIARATAPAMTFTKTGLAIGTPGYMAPEQARGERELTPAVDVFGAGCLFYECATGRPAFAGTGRAAVLAKVVLSDPAPFRTLCPEAPEPLAALVDAMLAKRAAERPQTGAEIAHALAALGPIPDGPRRCGDEPLGETQAEETAVRALRCLVLASSGAPEDRLDPPTTEQRAALLRELGRQQAALEVLDNGMVLADLEGPAPDVVHRSARVALAMREILPGWSIVVSRPQGHPGAAIDGAVTLLATAAMEAIFRVGHGVRDAIEVDPLAARWLDDGFELELRAGANPRLLDARRPA
jgi:eukaryotic-like serine/threonine-protein kinase